MSMFRYRFPAAMIAAVLVAGAGVGGFATRGSVSAQGMVLPPIFEPGARLLSPTGPVHVEEVMGEWIRVKSRHPLAKADGDQWIFVPSLSGTWLVDPKPADEN
ncbi:MAG: hypothetical protein SGI88_20175 [Candidatus Hydrogenedentes bacterium]|nr:hypothetical protein [Candidatus Hydrogenedentota bacterium]